MVNCSQTNVPKNMVLSVKTMINSQHVLHVNEAFCQTDELVQNMIKSGVPIDLIITGK